MRRAAVPPDAAHDPTTKGTDMTMTDEQARMTGERSDAARLGELLDRADITDVIGRYCFGMDSRDWEMYRGAWTDEMKTDPMINTPPIVGVPRLA